MRDGRGRLLEREGAVDGGRDPARLDELGEHDEAPACSGARPAGAGASFVALAVAYSAKVPTPVPRTSSPGRSVVTPARTASTTPASSRPRLQPGYDYGAGFEYGLGLVLGGLERDLRSA